MGASQSWVAKQLSLIPCRLPHGDLMRISLPLLFLTLVACRASQAPPEPERTSPQPVSAPHAVSPASKAGTPSPVLAELLPRATKPLTLRQSAPEPTTLLDLVNQLQASTGVSFILEESTMAALRQTPAGLQGELEVSADQAWRVVETVLVRNEFVLLPTKGRAPQLITIMSLTQPNAGDLKSHAVEVQASQLEDCVNHPAVLVMTIVDVHPLDARMTATSLRQLLPDQTTKSILPIGAGNQLLIVGFGPEVAKYAGMLKESARVEREHVPDVQPAPEPTPAR